MLQIHPFPVLRYDEPAVRDLFQECVPEGFRFGKVLLLPEMKIHMMRDDGFCADGGNKIRHLVRRMFGELDDRDIGAEFREHLLLLDAGIVAPEKHFCAVLCGKQIIAVLGRTEKLQPGKLLILLKKGIFAERFHEFRVRLELIHMLSEQRTDLYISEIQFKIRRHRVDGRGVVIHPFKKRESGELPDENFRGKLFCQCGKIRDVIPVNVADRDDVAFFDSSLVGVRSFRISDAGVRDDRGISELHFKAGDRIPFDLYSVMHDSPLAH